MSLIAKIFSPDENVLKDQLHHWSRFDQLQSEYGIALLIGLKPDFLSVAAMEDWGFDTRRNEEILDFGITLLNGDEINSWPKSDNEELSGCESCHQNEHSNHPEKARTRLAHFAQQHSRLREYWNSGKHPEFTPLSYFVEWARSKGFNPDWAPIAVELGLIPGATSVMEEKPMTTTERNTLLTIIAALCGHSKINYKERGASQRIMEMTDDIGAHVDDGTIRNALKKIPEALETRMK